MNLDTARNLLTEQRSRLAEDLENLTAESDAQKESLSELSVVDQHPGDIGTETFEMEKNQSIIESLHAQLRDIDEALARVDDGSYGSCAQCHQPIPDARLEAVPAARFCVEHQAEAEGAARA